MENFVVNRMLCRASYLSYHRLTLSSSSSGGSHEQYDTLKFTVFPPVPELGSDYSDDEELVSEFDRSNGVQCRGLLCFDCEGEIFVCDPTTKQTKIIPPSAFDIADLPDNMGSYRLASGFGYDGRSEDFKIVKFMKGYSKDDYVYDYQIICEMYEFKTNSWKEIPFPDHHFGVYSFEFDSRFGAHVNGTLYWVGYAEGSDVLLSFDLAEEAFTTAPCPPRNNEGEIRTISLSLYELDGKLGCFGYRVRIQDYGYMNKIQIWVRDEEGSWMKMFDDIELCDVVRPVRLENDHLFVEVRVWQLNGHPLRGHVRNNFSQLQVYDLNTKKFQLLDIYDYKYRLQIFPYIQS